jgi:acetate kinase
MKILIVNAGSSSLKFQLIKKGESRNDFKTLINGIADGIGRSSCFLKAETENEKIRYDKVFKNHKEALNEALNLMTEKNVINKLKDIDATGHRVVHGGEKYRDATKITKKVKDKIKELSELAPLHNPPNLEGINACESLLKSKPNIAVFDTAFHQTIPKKAYKYAIPHKYYEKYGIRRYGFHGTSHKYIADETYKLLKSKNKKIITCHLGNGASMSAIVNGKCIDTSMGFTPLEGIPMGTRSGSIDPAIPLFIMKKKNLDAQHMDNLLNKRSGIQAVSKISSDVRDIWSKAKKNNKQALFTLDYLAYKYALKIGSYAAAMNGVDAITFTAGIGQNAWYLRRDTAKYLEYLGVKLDARKNKANKTKIHSNKSKVKVFIIETNEGLQIAKEVFSLMNKRSKA